MKSYTKHLATTSAHGEKLPKGYRPKMRSSAVFPVYYRPNKIDTCATFLGYWLLKRNLKEVSVLLTLRSNDGTTVACRLEVINQVKSYSFFLSNLVFEEELGDSFEGSLELEVFSTRDMVFPFPAVTFSYFTEMGNSFVHTCGRIYNDIEDLKENSEQSVPETGFDIVPWQNFSPYFSFVNGPYGIDSEKIHVDIINQNGESKTVEKVLNGIPAYGTAWINVFGSDEERAHLGGKLGTVRIRHKLQGFFPRFVAGNVLDQGRGISLTHSYYDTSDDKTDDGVWLNPLAKEFYDAVVSFPVSKKAGAAILVSYPNLVECPCSLSFEFYREDGVYLGQTHELYRVAEKNSTLQYFNCSKFLSDLSIDYETVLCKVVVKGGGKCPTRMKFGLNYGTQSGTSISSNICFAAIVPNSKMASKPSTFKWCTLFSARHQDIFLTHSGFLKSSERIATVLANVWRESDTETLEWEFEIPWNGVADVVRWKRSEIESFLKNEIGWITFRSDSPFVNGFYLTDFEKGVVGADHLY